MKSAGFGGGKSGFQSLTQSNGAGDTSSLDTIIFPYNFSHNPKHNLEGRVIQDDSQLGLAIAVDRRVGVQAVYLVEQVCSISSVLRRVDRY